jgi:hypothetical protein
MEDQDGGYVGRQRSVDHCGSRYYTYRNISIRLEKNWLEGEEHNLVMFVRFSITECVRGSYNKGIMG